MPVVLGPCPRCQPHGSASLMASFPYFFVILTPPSYYCSFLTETSSAASQDKQQHTRHLWGVPLPRSRHTLSTCLSRAPCLWMRTWVCHSCPDSLSSASPLVFPVLPRHTHSAAPLPRDSQLLKAPCLLMIWHLILISLFMRLLQDSTYCPLEWLLLWAGLLVTMQFNFLLPRLLPRLHSEFQHHWNCPSLTFHIEMIVVDPGRARFSRLLRKLCTGGLLEPLGFRAAWTA